MKINENQWRIDIESFALEMLKLGSGEALGRLWRGSGKALARLELGLNEAREML